MSITEPPCVILLYRAILTLAAVPDPDAHYFKVESTWPTYARRYLDAYNSSGELELPWLPTPHDVTTYLTVLAWARDLSIRQRHIMELRARGYSLSLIAELLHSNLEDIERHHAEAVRTVVAAAAIDTPSQIWSNSRRHHCA